MPDRNAAAQRVLSVAKALRESGYEVAFYGITKTDNERGSVDGFDYEAIPYPSSLGAWLKYAIGADVLHYIEIQRPDYIFTYNYPAIAQEKIIRYAHKNGILVVGDITEWYQSDRLVKKMDTFLRMRYSNRHLHGIIPISRYLADYYKKEKILCLPPMVDKAESKWGTTDSREPQGDQSNVKLIYVGSPSAGKDRLDYIIDGISSIGKKIFSLDIVGIDQSRYKEVYGVDIPNDCKISFHGRLPHKEAISLLRQSDFQIFFRENSRVNNAGFPTKFVESISAGVPVITNRTSNISDYISDGKNSFLIDSPTALSIHNVLDRVASLTRVDIEQIKSNINSDIFDYHNYIEHVATFMTRL